MLLYKLNYYGTPFEYYGGYASPQSGSLPAPPVNYEPFTQNDTYYYEAYGYKIYNSAILNYGGSFWVMIVFPSPCYVAQYVGNNLSQNLNYNSGSDGAYTESVLKETVGGIEIVRNRLWSGFSPSDTDLPVFTSPQEYMDYITSPLIAHEWECVPYLNTTQGRYHFTEIDADALEDTDSQYVSRDKVNYVSTKITDFLAGIPDETVNILETAPGNRMVAKRDSNGDYYLGFAVGSTIEWYDTISQSLAPITSIGFVIDWENGCGKYFKCYEQNVGGVINYVVLYSPI